MKRLKLKLAIFDGGYKLVGSHDVDLTTAYYQQHHRLTQWFALSNELLAHRTLFGFVKASVSITPQNEEHYIDTYYDNSNNSNNNDYNSVTESKNEELTPFIEEASRLKILFPFNIRKQGYLLQVTIYQIDKLIIMDTLSKSTSPYIEVYFAGLKHKSHVYAKGLNATVDTTICLPIMEPVVADRIIIQIKHHNNDAVIGTHIIPYRKSKKNLTKQGSSIHWVHLYGSHPKHNNDKYGKQLNNGMVSNDQSPWYRGSFLMKLDLEKCDSPQKNLMSAVSHRSMMPKIAQWLMTVDVYQANSVHDLTGLFFLAIYYNLLCTPVKKSTSGGHGWSRLVKNILARVVDTQPQQHHNALYT